jgi:2-oxoglutarate ferredoxin oxidoreductase subunit alpha
VAQTAIERGRALGLRVGLFRPISLWPFPAAALAEVAAGARAVVVVEMAAGQLAEDVTLALGTRGRIFVHGRTGGMVPTPGDVLDVVRRAWATSAPQRRSGPWHGGVR